MEISNFEVCRTKNFKWISSIYLVK